MTDPLSPSARNALVEQAFELHRNGAFMEAEVRCHQVLRQDPDHFAALNLLGLIAAQQRTFGEAEALMRKAAAIDARQPDLFANLGYVLREQGRPEEALEWYDRALALNRDAPLTWYNQGLACFDLGRFEEAAQSFERVTRLSSGYLAAWNNLGASFKELRRYRDALECYDRILSLNRTDPFAWNNRAVALNCLGNHAEAMTSCQKALAYEPRLVPGWINMANTCKCLGRYDEALRHADQALRLDPRSVDALVNMGAALVGLFRGEEAARCYEQALRLSPARADVHNGLSLACLNLNRIDEGLGFCEQALTMMPDNAEYHNNRGMFLNQQHRFDEARTSYLKSIELDPGLPDPRVNLGLLQLLTGEFILGGRNYEWRWMTEWMRPFVRRFDKPLWLGKKPLKGKTILLHSEQGFGDTLLACRYLPMFAELETRVIVEVEQPLVPLLAQFGVVETIIPKGEPLPAFDFHCPMMSLPFAFGTTIDTIPSPAGYLVADKKKVTSWSRKLGKKSKPRVGLVWSGSVAYADDRNRSIPLSELLPILSFDFEFVSLHVDVRERDENELRINPGIRHFGEEIKDFSDTAALCKLVDVVVGVDTVVLNLAGALGRPVMLMLPYSPDWRWMLDRSDSPWYRSVKLFRQQTRGQWGEVVEAVAAELSAHYLK